MAGAFINQSGYAAHQQVSRKTVTAWKHRGLLVLDNDGLVNVDASDMALSEHGLGNRPVTDTLDEAASAIADRIITEEGAPWTKAEAERVKENYLAKLRQIEHDRAIGAVVDVEEVTAVVVAEYSLVRNRLLNIGSKIAPRAAVLQSAEEVKALIDEEIALALKELTLDGNQPGAEARRGRAVR